jgi:tetratricopeptide (TPR) repeat protein
MPEFRFESSDESMKITGILFLVLALSGLTPAQADGGNWDSESKYAPFHELIADENYQQAVIELQEALLEAPDDPDLLNLYAFSQRNLNKFDTALENYQKALRIDPEHRGANEYLGELYLLLDQPDKAEERLAVLDKECFFGCEEFDELKQAIEGYREQNPS